MRRVWAYLLVVCFLGLGTGVFEYLHNLDHEREDAQAVAGVPAHGEDRKAPAHDDSNCFTHAQLHLARISVAWVPLLICLGLLVAFLSELVPPLAPQRAEIRIDCRGPPAC